MPNSWSFLPLVLVLGATEALAAPPVLHPNSEPYRVSQSAATGRSGSATLQARTLLDAQGLAHLELTTGEFDSADDAPGELAKVLVKTFGLDDGVTSVANVKSPSTTGEATLALGPLFHGQELEVQANIRGIDGSRTDVVTVADTVWLRPDLTVSHIEAPQTTPIDTLVHLDAVITEQNLDVGARTDCVLLVDEIEVDRAVGIWVDAGDSVSCAFAVVFDTPGLTQLDVVLQNTAPTDYDSANDGATAWVEVFAGAPLAYEASFTDRDQYSAFTLAFHQTSTGSTTSQGWDDVIHKSGSQWEQISTFVGSTDEVVAFPVSAEIVQTSAGEDNGWSAVDLSPTASDCASDYNPVDAAWLYVCATGDGTTVEYRRRAGSVVYHSARFARRWAQAADGTVTEQVWIQNSTSEPSGDTRWAVGDTWTWDVRLSDATGAQWSATATAELMSTWSGGGHDPVCNVYGNPTDMLEICYESERDNNTRTGSTASE